MSQKKIHYCTVFAFVIGFTNGVVAAPVTVETINQCISKKIEQSPTGYENRCKESVTLHFRDIHQPYQVTIHPGQTKNPNPMGTPYYACPESLNGRKVNFDWAKKVCQV